MKQIDIQYNIISWISEVHVYFNHVDREAPLTLTIHYVLFLT